jgi:hypothetical protein
MKKLIVALLVLTAAPASAGNRVIGYSKSEGSRYFRLLDPMRPELSAASLFNVKDGEFYGGVTDLAVITHDTADGTIIPEKLQGLLPPAAWTPLKVGVGGSLSNRVVIDIGMSYNVGATLATSIIKICGLTENPTAVTIRDLMVKGLDTGKGDLGFELGIGVGGDLVSEGHFQSFKNMFPGEGIKDILHSSAKYSIGLTFRPK